MMIPRKIRDEIERLVKQFIWGSSERKKNIALGRVLSNVERVRRALSNDPSCLIYGFHSKDILHILRDCPAAKDVWAQVADCLAKQALIEKANLQVLEVPPEMARTFIDRDKFIGVTFAQALIL
ncbi:hypothetical protein PVK06_030914 [Gossypium arboreum]|uniref:Reverse transcriptase n=1 Tax=Gossypium arboreum TaxID=29729 RepID=A0ABR0NQ56_GOSAR|nr:hypothetical protein PVK06_030914 [Gossypium arboreum]